MRYAGKTEVAADRIRAIGRQRRRQRLDRLAPDACAELRRLVTEMYGE